MSEKYVHLIGAEQVQSAANSMNHAADQMRSAANTMLDAVESQRRFMDDWLERLAALLSGDRHG